MFGVRENLDRVWETIREACEQSNRKPEEIRVVAVSKGFGKELIQEAVQLGIKDFGENYLQEALPKQEAVKNDSLSWHFIGHLQRNKASLAAERFHLIQSVDSLRLAESLQKSSEALGRVISYLIQVTMRPETVYGVSLEDFPEFLQKVRRFPGLKLIGIMTMAPSLQNSESARPYFKMARKVFQTAKELYPETVQELSMGMSGDYAVAVAEGATMVRLGRAIFGRRPAKLLKT